MEVLDNLFAQAAKAAAYYVALIVLVRIAGKRMAGQTTTFDLLVLITLGVVIQSAALSEGAANAAAFVLTVFGLHRLNAWYFRLEQTVGELDSSAAREPEPATRTAEVIDLSAIQEVAVGLREYALQAT